ncbi:unnamed protein product [Calypogeia fissa]
MAVIVSKGAILLRNSAFVPPRMRVCPSKDQCYGALSRLQSVPGFSCSSAAGRRRELRIRGVLSLDGDEGGGGAVPAVEGLQHRCVDKKKPPKIWVRKQSTTRALGLNKGVRLFTDGGQRNLSGDEGDTEGELLRRDGETAPSALRKRWFPHVDAFKITEGTTVTSGAIMELLDPFLSEERKQRIETVVDNRTYSVCTVIEGLSDTGNVSAICRTADAMGFQSIHVISNTQKVRYRENHRTSAGAEKWLDMERWDDTETCIKSLKARGYRVAVTHIAEDTLSIHDMDWTVPTAIVLGNEHRGISEEAIALSDVRCSIPMAGMVESFNVSVAAAILMHHAVIDRIYRQGSHGDLLEDERRTLLAEFYMRHRDDTKDILKELVGRKIVREELELTETSSLKAMA